VLVQVANIDGDLVSSDDFSGMRQAATLRKATGPKAANPEQDRSVLHLVQRIQDRRQVGSGVAMRKVYPGYFSKMVMAHEMGHYFGLCHINHNGV